jgi:transcriptional regulator with XRE-family HTH domain
MDDLAVGRVFRELRIRLGWPQREVARRAGVSQPAYSAIERGAIERVPVGKLRKVAAVLEVRLTLEPRWRGAALDRALSSRHAGMTEVVVRMLIDAGWDVRPEVSFNHWGERGVVDIVAWHPATQTLLLVELKTELVDINDLLTVTDRRRRIAASIAAPFGWDPARVAQWVVVASSRTNERRLADARSALRAAFPADGRAIAGWLANPTMALSALWFLPDIRGTSGRRSHAPRLRVRVGGPSVRYRAKTDDPHS